MLLFALFTIGGAWAADGNLALNKTATASSGDAALAVDGNTGTRWESAQTDDQWWMVDLGEAKEFNTIQILWEGAYGKTFTIEVSTDGEIFTEAVNVADQTLAGFPYAQNFQFEAKTARYVKFNGIARGTGYGYSFWEFGVYNLAETLSLASLNITVDKSTVTVGGKANFTVVGKDQLDGIIADEGLTWESTTSSVGTVVDGVFTGATAGTTDITAKKGSVVSNAVTMTVVGGEKIDLFTNYQYRIYNIGEMTKSDSKVGAFDANDGSVWSLIGNKETAADETSRTYETGFIADLGAIYDITSISIHFEGACSEAFGLAFAGADGVFGDNVYTGGKNGVNNHTEEFSGESVTNARYVKFLSTKASTQWGVKIYDFSIFGIKKSDIEDTEVPTVNATEAAKTDATITLTLSGTDNSSKYLTYEVAANGIPATYFYGPVGENTTAGFTDLNDATTYNFAIYAIDGKGNRSAIKELSVTTTGEAFVLTAAPTPTKAAADVISIYSDAYTPATTYEYGNWSQSTQVATQTVSEDNMLHLTNFNYLGFEYATQLDLSEMEYLHIDVLPMQDMNFGITPIIVNIGSGTATEKSQSVGALTVKEWNSIDIPLSQFNMDFTQLSHQMKIDKGTGTEVVYIDNIYFWKEGGNSKTVKFANSVGWENVYAYTFDDSNNEALGEWPGTSMTKTGNVYSVSFEAATDPTKVIFHNNAGVQTPDLTFADGEEYDYGYYVVGDMNSWAKTDGYAMIRNTYCTSNVEYKLGRQSLTAGQKLKVVLWNGANIATWYPEGMGTDYTVAADGTYNIFFRPNADGGDDWHYNYIWAGTVGDLENLGTNPVTGAQVLEGTWNADDFAAIDATAKASSYDMRNVTGISGILDVIDKTANPYCLFITSTPGTVNRNEVVWNAGENRYDGYGLFFKETWNTTNVYDIATNIAPIQVTNPFFQRMFDRAGYYVTMTVPFDLASIPQSGDGTTFYEMSTATTADETTTISFTEASSIEKNKPYLVYVAIGGLTIDNTNGATVTIDWADNETTGSAADFKNNYTLQTLDDTKYYVLPSDVLSESDITFKRAAGATLRPFRAYLEVNDPTAKINVVFNDATGIHTATAEQLEGIFNIYSIDGKLVRQNSESKVGLEKGLYIINGKKVIVK